MSTGFAEDVASVVARNATRRQNRCGSNAATSDRRSGLTPHRLSVDWRPRVYPALGNDSMCETFTKRCPTGFAQPPGIISGGAFSTGTGTPTPGLGGGAFGSGGGAFGSGGGASGGGGGVNGRID